MPTSNELDVWANRVAAVWRAATRDQRSREAGVFVIFTRGETSWPEYAPGNAVPDGAYLVERWVRNQATWELRYE